MTFLDWVRNAELLVERLIGVAGSGAQQFAALAEQKMVGHAGDVVANNPMAGLGLGQLGMLFWHAVRVLHEEKKKRVERSHGAVAVLCDCGIRIEPGVKKSLQFAVLASYFRREGSDAIRKAANVFDCFDAAFKHSTRGVVDQVGRQAIENLLERFVEFEFAAALGIAAVDLRVCIIEDGHFGAQQFEIEQARFETVVEVGGVVSDFVNEIDELGFQRRLLVQKIFSERGKIRGGIISRMLDDAFAHFEGEIESGKIEVALLELFDDAKRVEIVIEAVASLAHSEIELLFARVAEGRVSDIVDESERFGQASVEPQGVGNCARNLSYLDGMGQAIAKMVGVASGENLRLGFQTAKGARVNYAIAIASVVVAVRMLRFGKAAPACALHVHRV